jgi:N-methylhydantoinase A
MVAINTILERTGAKAALLTTRGFRDVYEIGRINRPDAYNLFFQKLSRGCRGVTWAAALGAL